MSSPRLPNGSDLRDYIISAGLVLSDPDNEEEWEAYTDWDSLATTAAENLASATGRVFVPVTATHAYRRPDGRMLDLGRDLLSVSSLTVSGVPLIEGTHFYLGPEIDGEPYFLVEFPYPGVLIGGSSGRPISITGLWGSYPAVPESAWTAILANAAYTASPTLALAISQGLMVWAKGEKREEFSHYADQGPLSTEAKRWKDIYSAAVQSFTRTAL